jgi:hypothetical protein
MNMIPNQEQLCTNPRAPVTMHDVTGMTPVGTKGGFSQLRNGRSVGHGGSASA